MIQRNLVDRWIVQNFRWRPCTRPQQKKVRTAQAVSAIPTDKCCWGKNAYLQEWQQFKFVHRYLRRWIRSLQIYRWNHKTAFNSQQRLHWPTDFPQPGHLKQNCRLLPTRRLKTSIKLLRSCDPIDHCKNQCRDKPYDSSFASNPIGPCQEIPGRLNLESGQCHRAAMIRTWQLLKLPGCHIPDSAGHLVSHFLSWHWTPLQVTMSRFSFLWPLCRGTHSKATTVEIWIEALRVIWPKQASVCPVSLCTCS